MFSQFCIENDWYIVLIPWFSKTFSAWIHIISASCKLQIGTSLETSSLLVIKHYTETKQKNLRKMYVFSFDMFDVSTGYEEQNFSSDIFDVSTGYVQQKR
jgi:hypothetical protein